LGTVPLIDEMKAVTSQRPTILATMTH